MEAIIPSLSSFLSAKGIAFSCHSTEAEKFMTLVLIVEDAWFTRRLIRKNLEAAGYRILEAANGQEGLDQALVSSPDCILLDLLMPDMDGRDVLRTLRERGSQIPVLVLTADIQASSRQQCLDLGAIAVLSKPPDAKTLFDAIEQALHASGGIAP
jgi:CheY-like chemotaxis protein